jgi:uncharacterized membrane protein YagU involved in acid resistance
MPELLRRAVLPGAVGGIAGGIVFGVTMIELGTLDSIATIVRADPGSVVGWIVHLSIAVIVGIVFGLLVWRQRPGVGETLFWGLAYGGFFWFVGPLTMRPVFTDRPIGWNLEAAQSAFPALLGHLLYGTAAGLVFVAFRWREAGTGWHVSRRMLVRGGVAGLAGAALLGPTIGGVHSLVATWPGAAANDGSAWAATLVLGLVAGAAYACLYPRTEGTAGPALVRGVVYGFLLWIVAGLTILPALEGSGLAWSLEEARAAFSGFTGFLFLGVALAVIYHWLDALGRKLFSDDVAVTGREGAGAQALRALGRGIGAGLVGGALFSVVWIQVDFFPTVARLVGGESVVLGVVIHLLIAQVIGAAYGLLFRRQSYDLGSALGWGAAYGFFWWNLGSLTLLPTFLGAPIRWDAELAAGALPGLVGHLLYGASLGLAYYAIEVRHNPWWIARTEVEAVRRIRRRELVLTSAPALWALVVLIALTIPVLVGGKAEPAPGGKGIDYGGAIPEQRQATSPSASID